MLFRATQDLIAVHGYLPIIAPRSTTPLEPGILEDSNLQDLWETIFFRNVLSIFIGQIPLSLVSAGAYGTGKCLNGRHKSNILFLLKWMTRT